MPYCISSCSPQKLYAVLQYSGHWISLVNTFPKIYIPRFGEELRVLEGLQVIAFFSNPYHPYYSIAPGLSRVSLSRTVTQPLVM